MASLGASDEDIEKLGQNYLSSVEFGVAKNKEGKIKLYGAGILSSITEIKNAVYGNPEFKFWDPKVAEVTEIFLS